MQPKYLIQTNKNFPTLTKGLKKVADHLLSEPMIFAIHPAKKVGSIIGVSETMVIRFCHTIGYSGYSDLQQEVRKHLLDLKQTNEIYDEDIRETNSFSKSMSTDIAHIRNNMEHLEIEKMEQVVDTIINSERVVVAGYYHSFSYAHWMYFNLNYTLGNAVLYRPENDAGLLDLLPEKACIVIFSFYRYALDTIRLAEEAKSKGIKVVAITDSRVSPIVEFADLVIPINSNNKTLLSKGPVTLSLVNSLLHEMIQRVEDRGKIRSTYKFFIKEGE
ncbi:MurR/RpiR family transcriptional regulator [Pseudalkalibacillus sp. A8]|uniref:MurR/RpiR family transcriptional regulator n=1 Tax=Pseudalkalibacillus sp. A8 TaxID=3382641 RepID=UPI0038B551F1